VPMPVSTWVEVDLDRFSANLRAVRALGGPEREAFLVVKADAYGHGAVEIARAAQEEGVAALGVATLHEGIQLRHAGCIIPIVVLSPLLVGEMEEAVLHELDPTVPDLEVATTLSAIATAAGRPARCHVEVDTGMGRTGVLAGEAEEFLARLVALPGLRLASVYTHFPDADAEDLSFAAGQIERFTALLARLEARGIRPPRVHAANSAGAVNLPDSRFDWLRVGLLAYGHRPPHCDTPIQLQPVMSFKSHLVQVRTLPAGSTVSYGRTWTAPVAARVGVVAVGYGHGYSWLLSNRGHMLVRGRRVPIVGRVTMDLTMVNLEAVPDAQVGDEVVMFGEQGGESLPLTEVARGSETLPYEIMCTIGKRVTKIYIRDGKPVKLTSLVGENDEWTRRVAEHYRGRAEAALATRRG
jgi:alanine racemase